MTIQLVENFELPPDIATQKLLASISKILPDYHETSSRYTQILFDTFDWRLYQRNCTLRHQNKQLALCSLEIQPRGMSLPFDYTGKPLFWWHIENSALRDTLQNIIDMRALMPLVKVLRHDRTFNVLNRDHKTTARICCQSLKLTADSQTQQSIIILQLQTLRGYDKTSEQLKKQLLELGAQQTKTPLAKTVIASHGKTPGEYSSKLILHLDRQDTAVDATCTIMQHLLLTMRKNIDGATADTDTEFLHDFRVAVRRTRSALSQITDVFPSDDVHYFKNIFSRFGRKTNRLRDLDVYLLKSSEYEKLVPETLSDGLKPLFAHIRKERRKEQKKVAGWLQSIAFYDALNTWQEFLDKPDKATSKNSKRPVVELARKLITKKYRKIIKRGRRITRTTPDQELHDLRLDCKQIRYLIEFFASIFPTAEVNEIIRHLKILQDNLGDFNDLCIQQSDLLTFLSDRDNDTFMMAAIGGLITILAERQKRVRDDFKSAFLEFDNPKMAAEFNNLFG